MSPPGPSDPRPSLTVPVLPGLDAVSAAARRVRMRWPRGARVRVETDRERLVQDMLARVREDRWAETRLSVVLTTARALFDADRRERPDLAALRAFYVEEIRASTRSGFLDGLMAVYLDSYRPGAPHTRALAAALSAVRPRLGPLWQTLLDEIPACLDPDAAPEAVADRMLAMADPWTGLKQIGLRAPHAPGLMDHAHLAYVARLAPDLGERETADRLLRWLKPAFWPGPRQSGAPEALTALLAPWQAADPDPGMMRYLVQSLAGLYGDPRVTRTGPWAGVPEDFRAPLRRWLTGETVRHFLEVAAAVEGGPLWQPRRDFWLGLLDQGRIDAAWIAFSREAAFHGDRIARAGGARATLATGRQAAGGGSARTSLLFLQIGDRIVVEGTHDYMIHVFEAARPQAPKLWQPVYDCDRIRRLPGSIARAHSSGWHLWVLVCL